MSNDLPYPRCSVLNSVSEVEISNSITSCPSKSVETAQKRGSTILNLKCAHVSGLLGKSLIEFQSMKGDVLPPHKFGTHDVFVLKQNKADTGSPTQGFVYYLKDSSITGAFDDIPEDGLNSPLRLENLTNEVTSQDEGYLDI